MIGQILLGERNEFHAHEPGFRNLIDSVNQIEFHASLPKKRAI
jgi:hypothetical protein